ncbi:PREDICTED: protein ENHANCED DOWNY MILDEW 2 isoform X1 [Ipomoea nil]|uniref:protein ENHANCED DOWNY MILDEW 2 isoform X1 n=1 Tax=Ipomoea nil TaxID=35883 RepID=UPI0009017815|nr:PREDICTED: protein ENHANCED DOWNY MILDEW 2 isoform X1 [Ipomoea nil]XP_019183410.1 PREDICTED: protein ENHANCED DOWNY MILDEW 2 isoform X1 [Ipomoea nil]
MAFSDDEAEAEINSVSNYDFVDDNDEPISFSELSVQWKGGERLSGKKKHIFLRGDADNGNMKVYEEVTAWKFDLSSIKPDIWVLHKKNSWILLLKPRKAFEDTIIRTILVSLHCLHFFRKTPDSSVKAFWDQMHKVFSFEPRPSENDLVDHMDLISEVVKHDDILAKSKVLLTLLKERPKKKILLDEVNDKTLSGFIVDDLGDETFEDGSDDDEDDQFESVCAICDNGGEIICCEGNCLRSFHATKEAGRESDCESLGYTHEQVDAIQKFYCKNCEYQKHQCFACGELGSSDLSSGAEVFRCINATCGRFYHPHCVAKLLHREKQLNVDNHQKKIAAGEDFACPMHQCFVCNQIEDKNNKELQFAICRRCPRSYHRKCLPSGIAFEDKEDQGIVQRAWDDLIPNRILIYCLEHEIDEDLMTPSREHLKFPGINREKMKKNLEVLEKKKIAREDSSAVSETGVANQKHMVSKQSKGLQKLSAGEVGVSSKKREGRLPPHYLPKKQKVMDAPRKSLEKKASNAKQDRPTAAEGKVSLGQQLFELNQLMCNDAEPIESDEEAKVSFANETGSSLVLDADSKKRILDIVKDASSITLESVSKKHTVPTENAYSSKFALDKSITLGKVEGSIKAIHTALQRLEEGGSVDDAKVVCDPAQLTQIMKWKNKLKVYLAPFLYGLRYTSFGRHFTQVDKLKEIVNMLHWYVGDGDTVVDFCCGSNDFSCLMKKKLDEIGKKCSFKNFDILQAKNDFCFEKRDWITVQSKELPPGSKLIMGLNPPFGVNAGLANKFINKALEFKPKLLILIVPRETQRLDDKKNPYDLIWENDELLCGKAFYLPGSVDANDKTLEDWNVSTPPLYLWSRPDWTPKHKEIAKLAGHLSKARGKQDENQCEKAAPGDDLGSRDCQVESSRRGEDRCVPDNKPELAQSQTGINGCLEEQSRNNSSAVEVQNDHDSGVKQSDENSKQQGIQCSKEQRESTDITVENKSDGKRSLLCQPSPRRSRNRKRKGKSAGKRSLPRDLSPGKVSGRSIQAEDKLCGKTFASRDPSPGKASSKQVEAEDKYTGKRKRRSSSPLKGRNPSRPSSPLKGRNTSRPSHTQSGREDYRQPSNQRMEGKKLPTQSYSPKKGHDRPIPPSKRHEVPSQTQAGRGDDYMHFTGGNSGSGSQGRIPIAFGAHDDDEDVVRKYLPGPGPGPVPVPEPYSNLSNRWQHISSPGAVEYGMRGSDEHFMGHESTDVSHYGFNRMDEYGGRQSDMQRQLHLYGRAQQGQDYMRQPSPNMVVPNQGLPLYGQHPLDNDPTYGGMNAAAAAMRWHPSPQLHEVNHPMMSSPGFDPHLAGRSGLYASVNPRPPSHHVNALGFAQGPYRPFSQNNSGWLND